MCKSAADGGQRCAAHTRTKYQAAIAAGNRARIADATIEYASTDEGHQHLQTETERLWAFGHYEAAATLGSMVQRGQTLRETNKATAHALQDTGYIAQVHQAIQQHQNPATVPQNTGYIAQVRQALQQHQDTTPETKPTSQVTRFTAHQMAQLNQHLNHYNTNDPNTLRYVTEVREAITADQTGHATPAQTTLLTSAHTGLPVNRPETPTPHPEPGSHRRHHSLSHLLGVFSH